MSDLELMHFASEALTLDRTREYEQRAPMAYEKPRGFWVSVTGEDDWPSWCRSEEFAIERLEVGHIVTLARGANVLHIEDPSAFDRFQQQFIVPDRRSWAIDWMAVAAEFDGIIIAPYQWSKRLSSDWYYGWDVASGCIWNLDAIASVESVAAVTA